MMTTNFKPTEWKGALGDNVPGLRGREHLKRQYSIRLEIEEEGLDLALDGLWRRLGQMTDRTSWTHEKEVREPADLEARRRRG